MRSFTKALMICIIAIFLAIPAQAALVNLGTGTNIYGGFERSGDLIYESSMDVTWYDWQWPANNQTGAKNWANGLEVSFNGTTLTDWRLPTWDEYKAIYDAGVRPGSASDEFDSLFANRLWITGDNQLFNFMDPNSPETVGLGTNANALAVTSSPVPIPGAVWLLGTGLLGIAGLRRARLK